jgi:hypothetical protein
MVSAPIVQRESTPRVCEGPHCQPCTCWVLPVAIMGEYALAIGMASAQSIEPSPRMTTCNVPSGPFTVSHRVPPRAGRSFDSGIEVAGGNEGPGTAGAFEFWDAGEPVFDGGAADVSVATDCRGEADVVPSDCPESSEQAARQTARAPATTAAPRSLEVAARMRQP